MCFDFTPLPIIHSDLSLLSPVFVNTRLPFDVFASIISMSMITVSPTFNASKSSYIYDSSEPCVNTSVPASTTGSSTTGSSITGSSTTGSSSTGSSTTGSSITGSSSNTCFSPFT